MKSSGFENNSSDEEINSESESESQQSEQDLVTRPIKTEPVQNTISNKVVTEPEHKVLRNRTPNNGQLSNTQNGSISKSPGEPKKDTNSTINSIQKETVKSNNLNLYRSITKNYGSILFGFLIIIIGFMFTASRPEKDPIVSTPTQIDIERLRNMFIELEAKHPNQSKLFWANIKSSFRHSVLNSKDPSIVMIVYDAETKKLAADISNDIFKSLTDYIQSKRNIKNLVVSPNDEPLNKFIDENNYDRVKLHLDDRLNTLFKSGEKLAMIENIEKLPATSMLLFYTYGDDLLNAKFPGIMILMTLEIDHIIDNTDRINMSQKPALISRFVEDHLFKLWSPFVGADQLKPLFTRIANNVILVNSNL